MRSTKNKIGTNVYVTLEIDGFVQVCCWHNAGTREAATEHI